MPISEVHHAVLGRSFTLKFATGVDDRGKNLYITKTFSNLRNAATDADIINVGNALEKLQEHDLANVYLQAKSSLIA